MILLICIFFSIAYPNTGRFLAYISILNKDIKFLKGERLSHSRPPGLGFLSFSCVDLIYRDFIFFFSSLLRTLHVTETFFTQHQLLYTSLMGGCNRNVTGRLICVMVRLHIPLHLIF